MITSIKNQLKRERSPLINMLRFTSTIYTFLLPLKFKKKIKKEGLFRNSGREERLV